MPKGREILEAKAETAEHGSTESRAARPLVVRTSTNYYNPVFKGDVMKQSSKF